MNAYTIEANYPSAGKDFNVVRSVSGPTGMAFQTGFIFDISTKEEFVTFGAFQSAVAKNPPVVDWNKLSVTYKTVRGDTLKSTWNPPAYDAPKGKRVLVRPDVMVNGAVVPIDRDFINGTAVMKSPSVELVDRVLRVQTPAGHLEVDWRGKVPTFRNQQSHPLQEDCFPTALHADSPRLAALALDDYRELGALDLELTHAALNRGAVNE